MQSKSAPKGGKNLRRKMVDYILTTMKGFHSFQQAWEASHRNEGILKARKRTRNAALASVLPVIQASRH